MGWDWERKLTRPREMAVGNTFGATALSSYGGFWLSFAIVLTPGGFDIVDAYAGGDPNAFNNAFGFFLAGWFIFTFLLLLCTLRSTVAFFLLFFFLDLAFLFLAIAHLQSSNGVAQSGCTKAGGYFGIFAAFMAWYNALAGMLDDTFVSPFPLLPRRRATPPPSAPPWTVANPACAQQFLLRRPRRPFPLVGQGPRAPLDHENGARDGLDAALPLGFPAHALLFDSMRYTAIILDGFSWRVWFCVDTMPWGSAIGACDGLVGKWGWVGLVKT